MSLEKKTRMKARGLRFCDDQWDYLIDYAAEQNEDNDGIRVTASDIIRHAVQKFKEENPLKTKET